MMQIEYAKELLAVDCERIIETINSFGIGGCKVFTVREVKAKDRLLDAAREAVRVFKHPEGSV